MIEVVCCYFRPNFFLFFVAKTKTIMIIFFGSQAFAVFFRCLNYLYGSYQIVCLPWIVCSSWQFFCFILVVRLKKQKFKIQPVSPFSTGEGLPYAFEEWPNASDVWGWKMGRRANKAGYFHDRYLYLSTSLHTSCCYLWCFQSKPAVERYIQSNFPNMKIEEFFGLFSWKVPTTEWSCIKG